MMKVREVIRMIEKDGWFFIAQKGSHRQYKHPVKKGRVTVAGHPNEDMAPKTLATVFDQAQILRPKR
jgi:predicted RNA binding protein YcfA (HicA-like mRNA interferase family)